VLDISKAALFAAALSLSVLPGALPALAQANAGPSIDLELEAPDAPDSDDSMSLDTDGGGRDEVPQFDARIEVPVIAALDSSMDETALREVFTGKLFEHADELARLTATSITIPKITATITAEVEGETVHSQMTYSDIVISNVKDGHAETITIGAMDTVSDDGTTHYGPTEQDGADIRRTLELFGIVKGDPAAPMTPLYDSFHTAGGQHEGPLYACSYGEISVLQSVGRPVKVGLEDTIAAIELLASSDGAPSEAAITTVVGYVSDLLRSFAGGSARVDGVSCTGPEDGPPLTVTIDSVQSGDFQPGIYPDFVVSGVSVEGGELGHGALGEFVFKQTDLNPMLDALEAGAGALGDSWFEQNWRSLIPSFAGLSLAGLDLDVPNPEQPDSRVQAKVEAFDLSLGNYRDGIPTKLSIKGDGIEVPLPQDSTDPQVTMLLAAGLEKVNVSFEATGNWDEAARTIAIDTVSFSGVDLGGMKISGVLGNATPQLFSAKPEVATAAALALTVKSLDVSLSDNGIGAIAWPLAAAEEGESDVAAFRLKQAGLVEGLPAQLLGSTDSARQLGAALGDFIAGRASQLTVSFAATDANGVALPLFMVAQEDPSVLAGQFEVTGSAH
jgi:hypothetical protein